MKIDLRRLYTHPVLAAGRDDYKTAKFSAELSYRSDAANNLVVDVNFFTDCAELKRLIDDRDAEYLLHAECPPTSYREIFSSATENFSCKIPLDRVKKHLDCLALIVLGKDIKNFSCADWNEDFSRLQFNLQKGSVLAYQNFRPLPLPDDPNDFKTSNSIFSVHKKFSDDAPFDVEMTAEKIKIGLNAKDFALYRRYCSRPEMQPILNAMIILPTLVYVFEELKLEETPDHGADAWFLSLRAAYRRRGLNFDELIDTEDSLKLAQEVMSLPINVALENISLAFDAAEDS